MSVQHQVSSTEIINNFVACCMMTYELWKGYLVLLSSDAALWAPILGCAWLLIQMVTHLIKFVESRRYGREK